MYSCHLFLISYASVRSIPFLSFIVPIFEWNIPLVSLTFMKKSLVFPILLFSSISLHWSLRKALLSLLAKGNAIWDRVALEGLFEELTIEQSPQRRWVNEPCWYLGQTASGLRKWQVQRHWDSPHVQMEASGESRVNMGEMKGSMMEKWKEVDARHGDACGLGWGFHLKDVESPRRVQGKGQH